MLLDAQLPTLKAAIDAETDPEFVEYRTNGQNGQMAAWFSNPANPAFIVWRTSVSQDEIMLNGFDWTRVDNLSNGAARVWEWLFDNAAKSFNPSKTNVRAGIEQVWKGTAADLAVRAAVYVHCKRNVTKGERLFATGTGTEAVPGLMGYEGAISDYDVQRAVQLT